MIFDLHNDIFTHQTADFDNTIKSYRNNEQLGHVALCVWTTRLPDPLASIKALVPTCASHPKFCLAIEDLHFAGDFELEELMRLNAKTRILYAGLCWNHTNPLAAGALQTGGLTAMGQRAIAALERASIVVDTAHLCQQSFWDVVKYAKKPIINSHCCFFDCHPHARNLKAEQIRAIIASGGIIGLTFVPSFLSSDRAKIDDVFAHLDYFVGRFGIEHLAIGTDFFGSDSVCGLSDYCDFAALRHLMQSHGYTDSNIDAIFCKNAQKFFFGS